MRGALIASLLLSVLLLGCISSGGTATPTPSYQATQAPQSTPKPIYQQASPTPQPTAVWDANKPHLDFYKLKDDYESVLGKYFNQTIKLEKKTSAQCCYSGNILMVYSFSFADTPNHKSITTTGYSLDMAEITQNAFNLSGGYSKDTVVTQYQGKEFIWSNLNGITVINMNCDDGHFILSLYITADDPNSYTYDFGKSLSKDLAGICPN